MIAPSPNGETIDIPQQDEGPVEVLMRLAATAQLLRSTDGRLYAHVPIGGRREVYPLKSAPFRNWLVRGYLCDRGTVPSDWAIRRVLGALEALAWFEGEAPSISIRVGPDGNGDRSTTRTIAGKRR